MPCAAIVSAPSSAFPFRSSSAATSSISPTSISLTKRISKPRIAAASFRKCAVRATVSIEKETPEAERPDTFLRGVDEAHSSSSVRARFEKMIREAQDTVCTALEAADGGAQFKEDVWSRPGGGGGISRVLQDGAVWEKAGVNVSVVYGVMPPDAYRAAKGAPTDQKPGPVPFFAAGISSVLHPKNPFAPTLHFNYRYFETDAPKDAPGAPRQWWFGGGTDLTPAYIFEEDVKHFHSVQKRACDKFEPTFYPRFKKWCDDYFYIKHRGERRGLGGIFFDDLNDYDQEMLLSFATECANSVIPAYLPIIEKRKDLPFTEQQKAWQQLRRGRYVEFNLVYDRGTTFGLKTGGRIESILVSLPLTSRWEYDHKPEEGSEEWKLLDACINPKEWI
ncbi:hypothetical protein PHAVU_008G289900 [Phaseolus vulgaris]|uniref:coproporphyrinogen oxidase n=1 Tax=Phaseolus vulgaris TaxID=3885 RepID=V7BAC5_PHAVU|nr:hypothetical protein PHAVU_008G289900g [Phaseolus vulgaris]ESW14540.1 hypothetical protein PHAVU_008G289900g [Phaseolus vulgaris]